MVTVDFRSKEQRKEELNNKVHDVLENVKHGTYVFLNWCVDNKEFLAVAIPAGIFCIKKIDKHMDILRADRLRDSSIYDRSMGMYLVSKKPLTTAQKLDIDQLHKAGMSYKDIGKELGIKWK